MRPGSVSPQAGVSAPLSKGGRGRRSLARPKSMILACPDSVSMTFFGLRSRWTTPRAWASASPSATSIARSRARTGSSGRPGEEGGEGPAPHELHRDERRPLGLVDLVDDRDRGVRERRRRARLLLEPALLLGVAPGARAQDLERDLAAEGRVEGAVDDPHAAPPDLLEHLVVGERLSDHACLDLRHSRPKGPGVRRSAAGVWPIPGFRKPLFGRKLWAEAHDGPRDRTPRSRPPTSGSPPAS